MSKKKKNDSAFGLEYLAIYNDTARILRTEFDRNDRAQIVDWALDYELDGIVPDLTNVSRDMRIMFKMIKNNVDACVKKREERSETYRNNANAKKDKQNDIQQNTDNFNPDFELVPDDDLDQHLEYSVPCTDGEYFFTLREIRKFEDCFRGVNVRYQLEKFRNYLTNEHPEKQTSTTGVYNHTLNWLKGAFKDTKQTVDAPTLEGSETPWLE